MSNPAATHFVRYEQAGDHQVPVISLRAVRSGDRNERLALAQTFADACRNVGFFYVEDHGVPAEFLAQARSDMRDFFLLPEQDKMSIYISRSPFHRGYHPLGEENALGSPVQDLKEVFDMALELPMDDPDVRAGKPFHGPNAWPEVMPRFKPTMLRLYEEWRQVCARISSLFAVEFGLPDDYFVNRTNKPMCQLRAAKYPPQETPSEVDPIGCGAHTDYGIVSIIWQIDAPGLQLKNRDGDWVNAPLVPGAFVCPIGDATEILTNGDWKATVHRVINLGGGIRHSSAFFFDPNYDCELAPLPAFVGDTRPPRFERTTMGAHVTRGFNGTFRYRTAAGKDGHS